MKKKIFSLTLIFIMLISTMFMFAGCGDSEKSSSEKNDDTSYSKTENTAKKVDNSTIDKVIDGYEEAVQGHDTETAYKYLDYMGIFTWQYLDYPNGQTINETRAKDFVDKYNEFCNDSTTVNKVNDYAKKLFTDEYYANLNDETNDSTTKYKKHEILNTVELAENVYSVKVCIYYTSNNMNSSYNHTYILVKKDNGYYFVSSNSLYLPQKADLTKAIK